MLRSLSISAALVFLSASAHAAPPRTHALIGTWAFDASASSFDGGIPYRSGTLRFEVVPGGIRVVVHIVEGTGRPLDFEYVDPADGTFATVVGNPFYDSESTHWLPDGCDRTERRAGKVTGVNVMRLSADRRSLISKADRIRPDGQRYVSAIAWSRTETH